MTPTTVGDGRLTTTATVSAAQRELTPGDNRQALTTAIRPVLWGYVFRDGNGDGIRQGWESVGIEDARLFLEQGGLPVALAISKSPHGLFQFETLAGGEYALSAEVPPGYFLTVPAVIAINIKGDREQVAYFGAWTGEAEPPRGRLFLPLVLSPR